MEIEVYKSKQRLTKSLVRQMPRGYKILCQPLIVIGHVVDIIPGEIKTGIFKSGEEYYTMPLDYKLNAAKTAAQRKTPKGIIEFKFSMMKQIECSQTWWASYAMMRDSALQVHIYIC